MKRILITGANSYIGTSFEKWLKQWPDQYQVDTVDMIDGSWRDKDFTAYDVVFHVAAIVHQPESKKNESLYFQINRDLALETATKVKIAGVKQFIFLSSMSIYGLESGVIDQNTKPKPNTLYGKSKYQAEGLLWTLADETFKVAILRPPMVYGKGCKGNYQRLVKLAYKTPVFPKINNKRSMLYIGNLNVFIKNLIDQGSSGYFFPQNSDYVNTSEMVRQIRLAHGKKIILTRLLNPLLFIAGKRTINKVFGNLVYNMIDRNDMIGTFSFVDSIRETERNNDEGNNL